MKKHPFHDVIVAYATGATIQVQYESDSCWQDTALPNFDPVYNWRVKPKQTDLEKYGVEVGDVWSTEVGYTQTVSCANVAGGMYHTISGVTCSKSRLKILLFRRGVVNKL